MSDSTPHYLRCSWCANYFDAEALSVHPLAPGKACCSDCAGSLRAHLADGGGAPATVLADLPPNEADVLAGHSKWQRCPICRKLIRTQVPLEAAGRQQNALAIHLQHSREDQKQHLSAQGKAPTAFPAEPESDEEPSGEFKRWAPPGKATSAAAWRFSLKAWYPESVDCGNLFWYRYALN